MYCTRVYCSKIVLVAIFENEHYAADQVYNIFTIYQVCNS